MWTLNNDSLGNDLCISVGAYSLSVVTPPPPPAPLPSALTSDLVVRPTQRDTDTLTPFLIISHWLVGCRLYYSCAQLLYLMVRVLDHSIIQSRSHSRLSTQKIEVWLHSWNNVFADVLQGNDREDPVRGLIQWRCDSCHIVCFTS